MSGSATRANGVPESCDDFETSELFMATQAYVQQYMSRYDCSHDFSHIQRVLGLARYILAEESKHQSYDEQVVVLAALLHDVGDKKYILPGEDSEQLISALLLEHGCSQQRVDKIVSVVEHVSYSNEMKHPERVQAVLRSHPELAIVQDADRLDAIGAVGIARCFAYGAVKQPDRGLGGSIEHFAEKLEKIEAMMKTETGRKLASERTRRLQEFRGWWRSEQEPADELTYQTILR